MKGAVPASALRYRKHWLLGNPSLNLVTVVLDRDPSPCFLCGQARGCRHKPCDAVARRRIASEAGLFGDVEAAA